MEGPKNEVPSKKKEKIIPGISSRSPEEQVPTTRAPDELTSDDDLQELKREWKEQWEQKIRQHLEEIRKKEASKSPREKLLDLLDVVDIEGYEED